MKKILYSFLVAGAVLSSCNMNEEPAGTLNDETAIQNKEDALKFRNGIYNNIRSITNGGYIYYADMQADMFIGTMINGNRLGVISLGNITSSDIDLESIWAYPYQCIAAVNYFLPKLENLLAADNISESTEVTLKRYRGESKWARAYYYYYLMDHYCQAYTLADTSAEGYGIPLVTTYAPTGDSGAYPGRSSLNDTFKRIEDDLADAYNDLLAFESSSEKDAKVNLAPDASYLSTQTVLALQARVALLKGDWSTAISKAESVINSGYYALCNVDDYFDIWASDTGSELIFVPYGNQAQSGAVDAIGTAWINADETMADYVASANALAMYEVDNDVRYDAFFEPRNIAVNGASVTSPCFIKYPGNPILNTGSTNALKNLPKPFRLSEMYLIVAEAAAMSNLAEKSNSALNELRRNRMYDFVEETYSGQNLINAVREERTKELIGEGFRISDLRRWQLGFARTADYTGYYEDVPSILIPAGMTMSYNAGDYRLILPIPTNEMETNPQLKGQQNPGY